MPASTFTFHFFITKEGAARGAGSEYLLGNRRCWPVTIIVVGSAALADVWESVWVQSGGILGLGEDLCRLGEKGSGPQVSEAWFQGSCSISADSLYRPAAQQQSWTDFSGILSAEIGSQWRWSASPAPDQNPSTAGCTMALPESEKNITLPSLTWDQMGRYRHRRELRRHPATFARRSPRPGTL